MDWIELDGPDGIKICRAEKIHDRKVPRGWLLKAADDLLLRNTLYCVVTCRRCTTRKRSCTYSTYGHALSPHTPLRCVVSAIQDARLTPTICTVCR